MARKKLEQYEKEIEQNSLKIRKIEDQCFYYKMSFDQLEERLKNLLNTHQAQVLIWANLEFVLEEISNSVILLKDAQICAQRADEVRSTSIERQYCQYSK